MINQREVIVLVGPMGVGKTTIGKKLARALKLPFTDTDALIVKSHGPIDEIFSKQGEATFREFERTALISALAAPGVVATGGGAVLRTDNQADLASSTVVYLATDGKHIGSRLRGSKRPLLQNGVSDWQKIYDERKPIYEKVADLTINTSKTTLNGVVDEIKEKLATLND